MRKSLVVALVLLASASATGMAAVLLDAAGCQDSPLFPTRMPEYRISDCKVEAVGVYDFFSTKGPKVPVEGKFTFIA